MTPAERAEAERKAQGLPTRAKDSGALAKAVALIKAGVPKTQADWWRDHQ